MTTIVLFWITTNFLLFVLLLEVKGGIKVLHHIRLELQAIRRRLDKEL